MGAGKPKLPDYRKLLQEVWDWKESDIVKGWFQMAYIHGSRVSPEFCKNVEDMNNRIKEALAYPAKKRAKKWK